MTIEEHIKMKTDRIAALKADLRVEEMTLAYLEEQVRKKEETPFEKLMASLDLGCTKESSSWKYRKTGWNACVSYIKEECEGMCHKGGYLDKVLEEAKED